jgi:hypothetical protein
MGISNDSLIAYGIDLGEEAPAFLEDFDGDLDEFISEAAGLKRPDHQEYSGADWSTFWAKQREFESKFPVELVTYCSYDYPMYILALRGTVIRASRGDPVEFTPDALEHQIPQKRQDQYRKFLTDHGYDPDEAKWFLTGMNG